MNPLQHRLAALRRWLRLVVTVRGLCWLLTLLLVTGIVAGWLDWRVHFPSLVRAVFLVATLGGAGYVAFRYLIRPWAAPADDLSLALRVEALYPFLKDSLASTVQFLELPGQADQYGSPELRQEVVHQSLRKAQYLDFKRVVDTRGVPSAGLSLVGSSVLAFALLFVYPSVALTALERLANPFGGRDWPTQTQLEVRAPARVARGEPVEIQATLRGVIPAQAWIEFDGLTPPRQAGNVLPGKEPHTGSLAVRRDRVEKSFRFQVKANDAVSGWHEVAVLPPPVLVPLDGRPSPQVHLEYPAYTDLPAQDLPDGSGNIEAVAGTYVHWQAATDRPVARAWIEYRPEQSALGPAVALGGLGTPPLNLIATLAGGREVWERVPLHVDASGQVLNATFLPRITGLYAVRLEDASGLASVRLFDLRVFRDPEPTVTLERPTPARDSLEMLPGAAFRVQVLTEDRLFALRSAYLEYRCRKADPPRRLPLYDHAAVGQAVPQLLAGLAGQPAPVPALRLRPQQLYIGRPLSLEQFRHLGGAPLTEGDVLTLQVCADDFDDVAVDKKPGRSHEIEIRVVSRAALEATLNKAQTQVQQEIVRLRKMQQEALQQVIGPEQQWRGTGRLRDRDVDQLLQAEQLQQQIRARAGNEKEGLHGEVNRLLQTMKDNHLPRSGAQDRMETVAGELDRLERQELNQIEPRLTRARKEKDGTASSQKPAEPRKGPLTEARRHQEEVEATLGELLKLLEPWGNLQEIKGEAQALQQEQRKLQEETRKLDKEDTRGQTSSELDANQKAALERAAELQSKLGERAAELLGKMERAGRDRQEKDPSLAEALREAARQGQQNDLGGQMKDAGKKIRENQLQDAGLAQQKSMQTLDNMVQALEEHREKELDRLRKKLKEAEVKMADLSRRQQELRKKVQEANQMTDPEARQEELRRLAREQEKLRQEAQEMVRELTRLRMERAARAAGDAAERMQQAGRQLTQNHEPDDSQEEALDRLNEARRAVQREQEQVEDELAREKLAKMADQLKAFKDRQEALLTEGERIGREVLQKKGWDRGLLASLSDLAENQTTLAEEAEALAKGKLAGAQVFARILTRSAEAMRRAAEGIKTHFEKAREEPEATGPDGKPGQAQREAVRRIAQLLETLKPEKGMGRPQPQGDAPPGGKARGGNDEGFGFLAQLKGLRILQQDVNDRTDTFAKRHPDPMKLSPGARQELQELRKEQQEISQMLDELTRPGDVEGGDK